jgi:hypothetical protein
MTQTEYDGIASFLDAHAALIRGNPTKTPLNPLHAIHCMVGYGLHYLINNHMQVAFVANEGKQWRVLFLSPIKELSTKTALTVCAEDTTSSATTRAEEENGRSPKEIGQAAQGGGTYR